MLLTAVKLRGSSRHSEVQMFLFSFPCFVLFWGFLLDPLGLIGTRFVWLYFLRAQKKKLVYGFLFLLKGGCCVVGDSNILWLQQGLSKIFKKHTQTYTHTCTLSGWLIASSDPQLSSAETSCEPGNWCQHQACSLWTFFWVTLHSETVKRIKMGIQRHCTVL